MGIISASVVEAVASPSNDKEDKTLDFLKRFTESVYDEVACIAGQRRKNNPNFEIVENLDEATLILIDKDGDEHDCRSLLPEGYKFVRDSSFYIKRGRRVVGYDPAKLESKTFLLILFHEIGHSKYSTINDEFSEDLKSWYSLPSRILTRVLSFWYFSRSFKTSLFNTISFYVGLDKESKRYLDSHIGYAKVKAKEERFSWGYALRALRLLDKQGLNILDQFDDLDEIKYYINLCLFSYQLDHSTATVMNFDSLSRTQQQNTGMDYHFISDRDHKRLLQLINAE